MSRPLSLAQLTALPCAPPQLLQLAAQAGCAFADLRLLPATPGGPHHPLQDDAPMLRETLAVMAGTGVGVLDLEVLRIGERFDLGALRPFLEAGQRLGARHILVAGDDPDEARLTANFAALCEAAAPHGLTCDLEFMPWTAVRDAATATRITTRAGQPNGGVLVDALHWSRSGSTLDDVSALPPERLHYAQICDGRVPGPTSVEQMIFDARCERLLPGEGGIPLAALLARLPADLPISVEVPSESRAPEMGYGEWAKRAVGAARAVLDGLARSQCS